MCKPKHARADAGFLLSSTPPPKKYRYTQILKLTSSDNGAMKVISFRGMGFHQGDLLEKACLETFVAWIFVQLRSPKTFYPGSLGKYFSRKTFFRAK